jgi:hypothetical protein
MIIYINEDRSFRNWVTHHLGGFVLDGRLKSNWTRLVLHRARCAEVLPASMRSRATTGSRFKACATKREELVRWMRNQVHRPIRSCPACSPDVDIPGRFAPSRHTPLCAEILEYVLDVASIHSDPAIPPYRVTVDMIVAYVGKSRAQVETALSRLKEEGVVDLRSASTSRGRPPKEQVVYPTALALATAPEYAGFSAEQLAAELVTLIGTTANEGDGKTDCSN